MTRLYALFTLCLAAFMACAFSAGAAERTRLTIGMAQFPPALNPNLDSTVARSYVMGFTHRNFTAHDADWQLVCLTCTELPTLENGRADIEILEDGTEAIAATYSLHEAARWGDGTPITSTDVVFTWQAMRDPESGVSNLDLFANRIRDITVLDDKNVRFHFDTASCEFAAINDFYLLPAHLEKEIFEANPAEYRRNTLYQTAPHTSGLWSGPYRVTQVEPGAYLTLQRNPHWWGKAPHFDEIVIRVIENSAALTANLLAGEVDMIAGELGVTLDQALAFERGHGENWQIIYRDGLSYEHIDLNLDHPILADQRVRRALLMGIDREALNQKLFQGRQPVAHGNISPLDQIAHDPDLPQVAFDPVTAGKLLDEAGWSRRGAWRVNSRGERLSLEFQTTAGNRTRELVQQFLVAQWRQLGIEIRASNQPPRVLFGETLNQRKFRGLAMYAWISGPGNIPRSTLHSEAIPSAENGWSGQNYPGWARPDVDEMLEALKTACTPEENRPLWSGLQRAYIEDLPVLPLYWRADAYLLPKWLTGLRPTGHLHPSSLWVEDWGVAE